VGELAKLGERLADIDDCRVEQGGELGVAACFGRGSGEPQVVGEAEEVLLGAVVEVVFGDEPGPVATKSTWT
jgi:hypothetical protein